MSKKRFHVQLCRSRSRRCRSWSQDGVKLVDRVLLQLYRPMTPSTSNIFLVGPPYTASASLKQRARKAEANGCSLSPTGLHRNDGLLPHDVFLRRSVGWSCRCSSRRARAPSGLVASERSFLLLSFCLRYVWRLSCLSSTAVVVKLSIEKSKKFYNLYIKNLSKLIA
jgi:hypothetical protein